MRRQHVREGTIDQFRLEDITDFNNNYSQNYSDYQDPDDSKMDGMKDPSQILLLSPGEDDDYEINNVGLVNKHIPSLIPMLFD
jgi:hypothetical protein